MNRENRALPLTSPAPLMSRCIKGRVLLVRDVDGEDTIIFHFPIRHHFSHVVMKIWGMFDSLMVGSASAIPAHSFTLHCHPCQVLF